METVKITGILSLKLPQQLNVPAKRPEHFCKQSFWSQFKKSPSSGITQLILIPLSCWLEIDLVHSANQPLNHWGMHVLVVG